MSTLAFEVRKNLPPLHICIIRDSSESNLNMKTGTRFGHMRWSLLTSNNEEGATGCSIGIFYSWIKDRAKNNYSIREKVNKEKHY